MKDRRPPARGNPRLPYRAPKLLDYGPIGRLTAGGSGASSEMTPMVSMFKHP